MTVKLEVKFLLLFYNDKAIYWACAGMVHYIYITYATNVCVYNKQCLQDLIGKAKVYCNTTTQMALESTQNGNLYRTNSLKKNNHKIDNNYNIKKPTNIV